MTVDATNSEQMNEGCPRLCGVREKRRMLRRSKRRSNHILKATKRYGEDLVIFMEDLAGYV